MLFSFIIMLNQGGSTYILTNQHLTTLYTGSTIDIEDRYSQHLDHFYPDSFSARYFLNKLVFVYHFSTIMEARYLESYIKGKSRNWKIKLIEKGNPYWRNLFNILNSEDFDTYLQCYSEEVFGIK